jgi:hypothetical protein
MVGDYSPRVCSASDAPPQDVKFILLKVYGFLVCKGERRVLIKQLPPSPASRGTPHCFIQLKTKQKLFYKNNSTRK